MDCLQPRVVSQCCQHQVRTSPLLRCAVSADQPEHSRRLRTEGARAVKHASSVFHELLLCFDEALSKVAPVALRINQEDSCFVDLRKDVFAKVVLDGRVVVCEVENEIADVVVELVHLVLALLIRGYLEFTKSTIFNLTQ